MSQINFLLYQTISTHSGYPARLKPANFLWKMAKLLAESVGWPDCGGTRFTFGLPYASRSE
jgi:hypothetical protein